MSTESKHEEAINAEIDQLRGRLRVLRATLEGPRVGLEIRWGKNYKVFDSRSTLEEAFARDDELYGEPTSVSIGGVSITRDEWETDPRNPEAAAELARRQEQAAEEARKVAEKNAAREQAEKFQRELQVALFDGDTQVSEWTSFAIGKIHLDDQWVKLHNFSKSSGPRLQLRTKDGAGISSANASVQEYITKTYAIAWRTVW